MRIFETIAVLVVLAAMFILGRMSKKEMTIADIATVIDTLWVQVHDTTFIEKAVTFLRHDTVMLAAVHDTVAVHDSVLVTVPISEQIFEGDNYTIRTEGYAVRLNDVWINYPTITTVNTVTTRKKWAFGVGAQIGYGYTLHGASPYAGIGVGFGYTF